MTDDRRNYVIVGAFVVAMVTALILWIALVSGRTGATDEYHIVYQSVKGLKTGVEILYEGYSVGLIERIQPFDDEGTRKYRVDVTIRRGWPIPEDSVATIAAGLFASAQINILGGTSSTMLRPGSRIPSEEAADPFGALAEVAGRVSRQMEKNIEPMLDDLAEGVPEIVANIEKATQEMNTTVGQVNSLLGTDNIDRVGRILVNMESTSADVTGLVKDLGTTRQQVERLIVRVDELLEEDQGELGLAISDLRLSLAALARHMDAITANMEATTRNMNEFSRQVRENPGVLIRGREGSDDD